MTDEFVGVLLRNHQGRLLLYKHIGKSPAWRIPGGKIERNETPLEAARRELYEETSLNPDYLLLTLSHVTKRYVDGAEWTGHIFKTDLPLIDASLARLFEPEKCSALGWFTQEELTTMGYIDNEAA